MSTIYHHRVTDFDNDVIIAPNNWSERDIQNPITDAHEVSFHTGPTTEHHTTIFSPNRTILPKINDESTQYPRGG